MPNISKIKLPNNSVYDLIDNQSAVKQAEGGKVCSFTDGSNLPLAGLKVGIEPVQDLHGYDSPWIGGAGKNKLPMTVEGIKAVNTYHSWSGNSTTINNVTITIETDENNNVTGIRFNGTASADITFNIATNISIPNGSYKWSNDQIVNISNLWLSLTNPNIAITLSTQNEVNVTVSGGSISSAYIYASSGNVFNNVIFKPMIRLASVTDSTFAPYSNICPISGHTEANVTVADDVDNPTVTHTYTIPFTDAQGNPITVYGGECDVVNGASGNKKILESVDLGDLNWTYSNGFFRTSDLNSIIKRPANNNTKVNAISSMYVAESWNAISSSDNGKFAVSAGANDPLIVCNADYTDAQAFKTAMSGVQLVYELATPSTFYTQPTSINSIVGVNNVTANCGQVVECSYVISKYSGMTATVAGSAGSASTASKLGSSNVGSATQPIYLNGGTATACTYTLGKSVPSDAVFTDHYAWADITGKPSSYTPSSHTHGNIQNGGTLQTNDITIASGDKLVVTDSSDSSKVARTSISFDGSTATKALTQKGTWETFGTSNLTIGTTSSTAMAGNTNVNNVTQTAVTPDSGTSYYTLPFSKSVNSTTESDGLYKNIGITVGLNTNSTSIVLGDPGTNPSDTLYGLGLSSRNITLMSRASATSAPDNMIEITPTDISLTTLWDGTNSSLKTSISAIKTTADNALPKSGGTMTGTIVMPGNDSLGIEPATNNYGYVGSSTKKFYKMYACTFYGDLDGKVKQSATSTSTNDDLPILFSDSSSTSTGNYNVNRQANLTYNSYQNLLRLKSGTGIEFYDTNGDGRCMIGDFGLLTLDTASVAHGVLISSRGDSNKGDILLNGDNNTWDGTNTSLKSAVSELNSKITGMIKIVSIAELNVTGSAAIAAGTSTNGTANIPNYDSSLNYTIFSKYTNMFASITSISRSGKTVTVQLSNISGGTHSVSGNVVCIGWKTI